MKDLEEQVNYYIERVKDKDSTSDELSDIEQHIFEGAIEAFHGKKIWDELNKYLKQK